MSKLTLPPLQKACSKDDLRPALQNIYFKGHHAIATNAHIIACVDMSDYFEDEVISALNGKGIDGKAWQDLKNIEDFRIEVTEKALVARTLNSVKEYMFCHKQGPAFNELILKASEGTFKLPAIGINPKLLAILNLVINHGMSAHSTLHFSGEHNAVMVTAPLNYSFGLIMPVMVHGDEEDPRVRVKNMIEMWPKAEEPAAAN